jgi:hypothetical protein
MPKRRALCRQQGRQIPLYDCGDSARKCGL